MHHAHRTTVVVLHVLVIASLLTAGLGGWIPAKAAGLIPQEIITNPIPDTSEAAAGAQATNAALASSAKPVLQDPSPYPAPGSEETPPPAPLPSPLPQETAQDEAENAAAILLTYPADSPLLARSTEEAAPSLALAALQAPVPGAELTLLYQAQIPEGTSGFSLELCLPKGFTWLGDAALLDAESNILRLPLSTIASADLSTLLPAGMLDFQLDPGITGPFEIQAALLQDGIPVSTATWSLPESGLTLLPLSGGTAEGLGGKVRVTIPSGAVSADQALASTLALRVRHPTPASMPPSSPSAQPFEITAVIVEDQTAVSKFSTPITIQVAYDETVLSGPEENLHLVFYDEPTQTWIPLSSAVDAENNLVTATSDHLTVFDLNLDDWNAARLPSLQSFQTDGYTGAATASYSFWTPPGPAGLQPSLGLSYHSQASNSAIAGYTQGSWVGFGWEMATGAIERDMHGTTSDLSDDTFSITTGGMSSRLLLGADGFYHTQDESFWRIQYNGASDSWTVWDKTGAKYVFGENDNSRATYPYLDSCASGKYIKHAAWRWSLSKAYNAAGKYLEYSYFEDTQPVRFRCQYTPDYANATIASYPQSISYPDNQYRVYFDLETRPDYRSEWAAQETLIFYQRHRLQRLRMERLVSSSYQTIRQYELGYTSDIFSGVLWPKTAPYQATQALQTIRESRTVIGTTYNLPTTTYTYDDLHLVQVENGYGGKIQYVYENPPWVSSSSDTSNFVRSQAINTCYYTGLDYGSLYTGGQADCTSMTDQTMRGENRLGLTGLKILQPGGAYRVQLSLTTQQMVNNPAYVKLDFGAGGIVVVDTFTLVPRQTTTVLKDIVAPVNADKLDLLVGCTYFCDVDETVRIKLLPTRYRVSQKKVYDGLNTAAQEFYYHFDEPAMNDARHSASGKFPYREFRGHALAKQSSSDGRAHFTFYRQDDITKGRPIVEMTTQQSYADNFEARTYLGPAFSICSGSQAVVTPLYGDPAAQLTGDSSERCFTRLDYNLQDNGSSPNAVIGQFLLQGTAPQGRMALETAAGLGFALYARADGALLAQTKSGGSWIDRATLLQPGVFQKDTWYVFMLMLDDNENFLARLWPRQHPEQQANYRLQMTAAQSWRFALYAQNGQAYLDTYSEGQVLDITDNEYGVQSIALGSNPESLDDLEVNFVTLTKQTYRQFNGDSTWNGSHYAYKYEEEGYGNLTHSLVSIWDAAASGWRGVRLSVSSYSPKTDGGKYLVGLPHLQQVYRCGASYLNDQCLTQPLSNSLLAAETKYLYDGGRTIQPQLGFVSARRTLLYFNNPDTYSDPSYADETMNYDAWGNLANHNRYSEEGNSTTLATTIARSTSFQYDTVYYTYVLTQTNALNQQTLFSYDYDLGLPTSMTGPNGSQTTVSVDYDPFGRPLKLIRPGDDAQYPTMEFSYNDTAQPYWIEAKQRIQDTQYAVARRFYDGLGQLIQTQNLDSGEAVVVNRSYNRNGELISQSMPYTQTVSSGYLTPLSGVPAVTYGYDALGRQTLQTSPDGTTQQTFYNDIQLNGWRVVRSVDAKGNSQVAYVDGLGRVQRIIPPTQGGSAIHPMVNYSYDALDRLSEVLRAGASTTLTYDLGGRKVALNDPDMGSWNYSYDAVSNLKTQTDARGCVTSMTYDKLERMLTKSFSGGIACSGNTVTMTYDQGANGIGRRYSMSDGPGYTTQYAYDARGRLTGETRSLDSIGVFASAWSYNSADLVATMRYPGGNNGQLGETVAYEYNQRMLASNAEGDYTYLNSANYDPAGRLTQQVLGTNQAQSKYTYYPWTSQGGRLQQITAGTLGAPEALLKLQYGYDLNGNITSIQDYRMGNPQTQSFGYDNLNRLLTASASGGNGGIGDYSVQSFTYNATTGNLETKAGAAYTYGNSLHPHAVMAVSGGGTFTYDANGNMTNKTYPSSTTYTYNGDNRLTTVSGSASASFLYDGDGQRFAATINGVTTVYIGEYFEWQPATGQMSKYYFAGGQRIAMRVLPQGQNTAPLWLFGDHLGSTSVVANNDGSQHSRQGYMAWGETRFSVGSLPTKSQYTGQISHEAELGLYFYKARYYNPALSRWIQPDTLVPDPGNPLDWDRYQYVRNNPIRYVDPTGNEICIDEVIAGRCYVDYHLYQFGIRTYGFSQAEKWAIYSSAMAKAEKYARPEESLANAYKRIMGDITYLVNENSPIYSFLRQNPPNKFGITVGVFFIVWGFTLTKLGIALFPHDPPVGLFLAGSSAFLFFLGLEITYRSLGDLRPSNWPDTLLNIDGLKRPK